MASACKYTSATSGCGLYTMTGVDWTERYPWIVEDVARLKVRHAIIDAECCCDGENGITDFERLMARVTMPVPMPMRSICWRSTATTCAACRWATAKRHWRNLLRKAKPGIRYSEHLTGDGRVIFERACMMGLEGIVSKRLNSPYRSGKVKSWLKVKNPKAAAVLRVQDAADTRCAGLIAAACEGHPPKTRQPNIALRPRPN